MEKVEVCARIRPQSLREKRRNDMEVWSKLIKILKNIYDLKIATTAGVEISIKKEAKMMGNLISSRISSASWKKNLDYSFQYSKFFSCFFQL